MSGGWLDGDFYGHPKVLHAWALHHAAVGIWALAISYAHKHKTSGLVSTAFVNEKLPVKRERVAVVAALTSVAPGEENPLWHPVDGGWLIHNFDKRVATMFSDPRKAERMRRHRASRDDEVTSRGDVTDRNSDVRGDAGPRRDKAKALEKLNERPELLSLSRRLADAVLANDPKADVAPEGWEWLNETRLLLDRDGRSIKEVEAVIDWCQADTFWHPNIRSMPKLRKQFGQLRARMLAQAKPVSKASDERKARNEQALKGALEGAI